MMNLKIDKPSMRIKLEFMVRTMTAIWRSNVQQKGENETGYLVSLFSTVGSQVLHHTRTPGVVQMSHASDMLCYNVSKLIIDRIQRFYIKLHNETRGLPITLSIPREEISLMSFCDELTEQLAEIYENGKVPEQEQTLPGQKINAYTCSIGHRVITVDRIDGVTPFSITCPKCREELGTTTYAESAMYKVVQDQKPEYEFYKPTKQELDDLQKSCSQQEYEYHLEHLAKGGLLGPRKIQEVTNG
jgi:hypothetical protein